jgi:Zn-dependent protease with chaperone function
MTTRDIVKLCLSPEERRKRLLNDFINFLLWAGIIYMVVDSYGGMLITFLFLLLLRRILAELLVRRLQAVGAAVSERQFPEIRNALRDVCEYLGVEKEPRVVILGISEVNALAIGYAKRRVIVLFSGTLTGILDKPEELRFVIGHEIGHHLLDFGLRRHIEIMTLPSFKAAREMTCDNIGHYVSGDLEQSKRLIRRLAVGHRLESRLDEEHLMEESDDVYSGFFGWLFKLTFTYPTVGKRIENLIEFDEKLQESDAEELEPEVDELEVLA